MGRTQGQASKKKSFLHIKDLNSTVFTATMQQCDILRYINYGEISCSFRIKKLFGIHKSSLNFLRAMKWCLVLIIRTTLSQRYLSAKLGALDEGCVQSTTLQTHPYGKNWGRGQTFVKR